MDDVAGNIRSPYSMGALVSGLRAKAAAAARARDDAADSDTVDLVGRGQRRQRRRCFKGCAAAAVVFLSLASVTMGGVWFYYWWTEGRYHAAVVYRYDRYAEERGMVQGEGAELGAIAGR